MDNVTMKQIQETFLDAFTFTMKAYVGEDRKKILLLIHTHILQIDLATLFRPDNLDKIRDDIMEAAMSREFLLDLTRNFLVRLGSEPEVWKALISNLAWSVAVQVTGIEESEMPEVYASRMPTEQAIGIYLTRNKWLVTYVMIACYIDVQAVVDA